MHAIKEARKLIEKTPGTPTARILSRLVLALKSESPFGISEIYQLDYDHFKLALEILQEWRIDRHYAKKLKLVDASMQAAGQGAPVVKPARKGAAVAATEAASKKTAGAKSKEAGSEKMAKPAAPKKSRAAKT